MNFLWMNDVHSFSLSKSESELNWIFPLINFFYSASLCGTKEKMSIFSTFFLVEQPNMLLFSPVMNLNRKRLFGHQHHHWLNEFFLSNLIFSNLDETKKKILIFFFCLHQSIFNSFFSFFIYSFNYGFLRSFDYENFITTIMMITIDFFRIDCCWMFSIKGLRAITTTEKV